MSFWKRRDPSTDFDEPKRSPENTLGVTESQILSAAPSPPQPPRPPVAPPRPQGARVRGDMSLWGGKVLPADEFAPEAGGKRRRRPWRLVTILAAVGGLTVVGAWVWRSSPQVPSSTAPARPAPVLAPVASTATATPAPTSPAIPPAATATPAAPEPAGKKAHSTTSIAKRKPNKRRHQVASKPSKRSHAKTVQRAVTAEE
jgi:hypothetical protein